MGTGYTRQSSAEILTGEIMEASDFNNEFNLLEDAFNATTGHSHDGTVGEGPVLTLGTGVTGTLAQLNTAITDATIASLTGTETLTNKTLTSPTINTPTLVLADANGAAPTTDGEIKYDRTADRLEVGDGVQTTRWSPDNVTSGIHGVTGDIVGTTDTQTLTNKTINLASNTLTGTVAQFNTALSDGSFATLDGTEILTNKTLTDTASITVSSGDPRMRFNNSGGTNDYAEISHSLGELNLSARNGAANGSIIFNGNGAGSLTEYARFTPSGELGIGVTTTSADLHIGNAATPKIRLDDTGGTNTYGEILQSVGGLYLSSRNGAGNGPIIFNGNASGSLDEYARFDPNGNFGIGVNIPSNLLHLEGPNPILRSQDTDGTNTFTQFYNSSGNTAIVSRNNTSDGSIIFYGNNGTISTEHARITSTGLGIGTTPSEELHISSSTPTIELQDSDVTNGYGLMLFTNTEMQFFSRDNTLNGSFGWFGYGGGSGTRRMTLDSGGQLGIGEVNPDARLEVNGTFRSTSTAQVAASGVTVGTSGTSSATQGNQFFIDGRARISSTAAILLGINDFDNTTGTSLIGFYTGGTFRNDIDHTAGTINYNSFLGAHPSFVTEQVGDPELLKGTLVETIDEIDDGDIGDRLAKVRLTDTYMSRRVYGTISHRKSGETDAPVPNMWSVSAIGAGHIRLKPGEIPEGGDAIVSSTVVGCGEVLDKDTPMTVGTDASIVAWISAAIPVITHPDGSQVYPCTFKRG